MKYSLSVLLICCFLVAALPGFAEVVSGQPEKLGKSVIKQGKDKTPPAKATSNQKPSSEPHIHEILQFRNPEHQKMLDTPTRAVTNLPNAKIDQLIDSMLATVRKQHGGVGISANQVGEPLQISIVMPVP